MSDTDNTKTGLVLEGGAMRGLFTCGVTDVMMEQGIAFDGAIGVSAGAVFGSNYKSRQPGRAIRYNKRFCGDKRYGSVHSLLRSGDMYDVEFCYRTIPKKLDLFDEKAYRENPMEFYVVCTDVATGGAVYHLCQTGDDEDIQWMRASASMPLVSKIVEVGSFRLLDGGIADSIPVRSFEQLGYRRNVVVLTQPLGYQKQPSKLLPAMRVALRRYPALLDAIKTRPQRYNETLRYIEEEEKAGRLLVLRPPAPLNIGRTESDPEELQRVYEIGRAAARNRLQELRAFLAAGE